MLTRGLTEADAVFKGFNPDMKEADLKVGTTSAINDGLNIYWYKISAVDNGSGLLLDNGLFANPVTDSSVDGFQQDINQLRGLEPNNQTGTSYTLVLGDAESGEVWMNNASPNTVTIPEDASVNFPIGTVILVMMEGAGVTKLQADTNVTLNGALNGSGDLTQYSGTAIKKRGTNNWVATSITVA